MANGCCSGNSAREGNNTHITHTIRHPYACLCELGVTTQSVHTHAQTHKKHINTHGPRWHMLAYTVLPDDAVCINEHIQNNAMFTQRGLVGVQIPPEYFT